MLSPGDPLFLGASVGACNDDAAAIERVMITVTSRLTGDVETFEAIETAPNSGVFRIANLATRNAGGQIITRGNGVLEIVRRDTLVARLEDCSGLTAQADVLVDPSGIVFDSRTNAPVAGARVTLLDASGNPAQVFDDGGNPISATITTGADGSYLFPFVAPGLYRLRVEPPPGFTFASKLPPALLPPTRIIDARASYGQSFSVNGAVVFDVPLDSAQSGLMAEKVASRRQVEVGEFVDYQVRFRNTTGSGLNSVRLIDILPSGFVLERGSVRLNGAKIDDSSSRGPRLEIPLAPLAIGGEATVSYRVRVGAGARLGESFNRAQIVGETPLGPVQSNVAGARVRVEGGVLTDKGVLFGKVFLDLDRDGIQDKGESGVPGVRIWTQDGTFADSDSDSEGKYTIYGLSPRTHIVKADNTTLPSNARLLPLDLRHAGRGDSSFADLKRGELHKVNFALASDAAGLPALSQEIARRRANARRFEGEVSEGDLTRSLDLQNLPVETALSDTQRTNNTLAASGTLGPNSAAILETPARPSFNGGESLADRAASVAPGVSIGSSSGSPGVASLGASGTSTGASSVGPRGSGLSGGRAVSRDVGVPRNGTVSNFGGSAASGQIGIDLNSSTDSLTVGTSPYVTLNDAGDADTGGNSLLNFPVITTATIASGNLTLAGFAAPGAVIEVFVAAPDPTGFGEGQTFVATLTEGVGDADAATGSYSGIINGRNQGSDTTNAFRFSIPIPSGVSVGTALTATATLSGATSEFSGNVVVATGGSISGFVYLDANASSVKDAGENSAGSGLFVKLVPTSGGNAIAVASVDASTGAYSFTGVADGNYSLVLDTNPTLFDTTAGFPTGTLGTEAPTGTRAVTVAGGVTNQNFGVFSGSKLSGRVFNDSGAGSGTANDGIANGTEAGLANTPVRATDTGAATTFATTTTDANGNYTLFISSTASATVVIIPTLTAGAVSTGGSAGTTGGTYTRANPQVSFAFTAGRTDTGVNFGAVSPNTFTNTGARTAIAGTSVYYPHVYTAQSAGSVSFSTANVTNPSSVTGFTNAIYRDTKANGVFDSGEPLLTAPVALTAGQTLAILVRENVPATAPAGATDAITTTATFTYDNATPALTTQLTRTDTTTSVASGLELIKAVDKAVAKPGEVLTYTLTYRNISSENLSALRLTDTLPAFTGFTSAAFGTPPAGLTNGTISSPAVGAGGDVVWTFGGSLAPNAAGTVTLRVTLK